MKSTVASQTPAAIMRHERTLTPLVACQRLEAALQKAGVPLTGLMGSDSDPPMMRTILRQAINNARRDAA